MSNANIICEHCGKAFTRKYNLKVHGEKCKSKELNPFEQLKNQINEMKKEIDTMKGELLFLREKVSTFENIKPDETKEEVIFLRGQVSVLQKPRIVNNNTFNISHFPSPATLEKICSKEYKQSHFKNGPEATYDFIMKNILTDEEGNKRLKCSDVARQIFKGKTPADEEFTDVGGIKTIREITKPLKKYIKQTCQELAVLDGVEDDDNNIFANKEKKHIRSLEPKRLAKRLAGDLR